MKINLNHYPFLSIKELPCGFTQNIEIKIGRKTYMVDVNKNNSSALVEFYEKLNSNRQRYSKYEANLQTVFVKTDSNLNKNFFENFSEIAKSQKIIENWSREVRI